MKKTIVFLVIVSLVASLFAQGAAESATDSKKVDTLSITFVPSRDTDDIVVATKPLEGLLKDQLAKEGWTVDNVKILVGTSYETAGEALDAGTSDLAFIPAGTYVQYEDGAEVILTALRKGKSVNSNDPIEWNSNEPITNSDELVVGYRSLIYSGITEKGKALAAKVNNGEELTWEELNACSWGVASTTSSAGYIYPSIWLNERYGKTVADLDHAVQAGYAAAFAGLASGMYDVIVCYADGRQDYESKWMSEWGRPNTIWEDMDVIGVTDFIMNDTISASKASDKMTPEFISALQNAFIEIAKTEEGKKVISIYNHEGYQVADDSDYDAARAVQKLFKK
ncbi:MAG: phosphate/phosphite/phosphonate ABC transporter substrate-binding protein [Candidatus Ornithospirochaeta sp.]